MADVKAGTEDLDRRLRYKVIRYRENKCVNCGQSRAESPFKKFCVACGESRKLRRRKKLNSKPWKAGSPGRPPLQNSVA